MGKDNEVANATKAPQEERYELFWDARWIVIPMEDGMTWAELRKEAKNIQDGTIEDCQRLIQSETYDDHESAMLKLFEGLNEVPLFDSAEDDEDDTNCP